MKKVSFKVISLQGKMQATFFSIQNANIKAMYHKQKQTVLSELSKKEILGKMTFIF